MEPKAGQIWLDKRWKEHLFITKVRINVLEKYDWVYWHNIEGDFDTDSSLDGFIESREYELVSG